MPEADTSDPLSSTPLSSTHPTMEANMQASLRRVILSLKMTRAMISMKTGESPRRTAARESDTLSTDTV